MSFRLGKSFKIAPGIRVNLRIEGASLNIGPGRVLACIGHSGTTENKRIPETAVPYRSGLHGESNSHQFKREQTRIERENARREKELHHRKALKNLSLKLNENGTILVANSFGEPLNAADMRVVWEQKGTVVKNWLREEMDLINGDVDLLSEIHLDTPHPDSKPEYQLQPYAISKPIKPKPPLEEQKPLQDFLPPLGFFKRFFKSKKTAHKDEVRRHHSKYNDELHDWKVRVRKKDQKYAQDIKDWKINLRNWKNKKREHDENENKAALQFAHDIRCNTDLMSTELEQAFNLVSWPRETLISYQIESAGKEVWVDVDLPEIEDLPRKVAAMASNGKKLKIQAKSQNQLRHEYASHIHGIALRIAGVVFASLPETNLVTISGYSQRLNASTGVTMDDYLYSVKFIRNDFRKLNFENFEQVCPLVAFTLFEHRRKMTVTGIFKAVEPFSIQ